MGFERKEILYYYDIFPKVIALGKPTTVHIRPTGGRPKFTPGETYRVVVCGLRNGNPDFPASCDYKEMQLICNGEGGFDVPFTFTQEQEYFIRLYFGPERGDKVQLTVFCVDGDLAKTYPYLGDLHMHTIRSDGSQSPEVVAANYRAYGYDFLAMTDHRRYYPSLDVMNFYKDVPTEFNLVPGEEVHMPPVAGQAITPHIVNFGGEYSINALVESDAVAERGKDISQRAIIDSCPDVMTKEEYEKLILSLAEKIEVPEKVDAVVAAGLKWIYDEIKKANGLGIFAHPKWINDMYHVPDVLNDYLVDTKMFDAFEVLGGENYYEHNGFQTLRYYEDRAKGKKYPIVGSTDSHSSLPTNRNGFICATIVFAEKNERTAIIDAIKNFRSVAVDTISKEYRLVGEERYASYACFLLEHYFPLHNDLCSEEGRLMRQYAVGTAEEKEEALKLLSVMHGRVQKQREKYFCL